MQAIVATGTLFLTAAAAVRFAACLFPARPTAVRVIAGSIAFYGTLIIPIQAAAALQLGNVITGIPLWAPVPAALAMLIWLRGPSGNPSTSGPDPVPAPGWSTAERVAAAAVLAAWVAAFVNRATSFPQSWDGVAYHLPLAVHWLQEGSVAISSNTPWQESLPGNGELLAMVALATRWQALGELMFVPAAAAALAAVHLLARWLGADHAAARASTVLAASLPIVLFQAFSAYVDLFGAALILAALALWSSRTPAMPRRDAVSRLLMASCACGVAIGTKPTCWPFAAAAVCAFGAGAWRERRRALAFAIVATALLPAAFWFLRNTAATGNPVYPLSIPGLGGATAGIAPHAITRPDYDLQFVHSRLEWLVYPWVEFKRTGHPFSTGSGLGPGFAVFAPIGLAYLLLVARTRRAAVAAAVLGAGGLAWATVLGRVPRFGLLLPLGMCALAGPFLEAYRRRAPRQFGTLYATAVALGAAIMGLLPLRALGGRAISGEWSRAATYDVPPGLDALPAGTVVINLNRQSQYFNNFALAGSQLRLRVVPYWRAAAAVATAPCGAIIVDRAPWLDGEDVARLTELGYTRQSGGPSDSSGHRWHVWRRGRCGPGTEHGDPETERAGVVTRPLPSSPTGARGSGSHAERIGILRAVHDFERSPVDVLVGGRRLVLVRAQVDGARLWSGRAATGLVRALHLPSTGVDGAILRQLPFPEAGPGGRRAGLFVVDDVLPPFATGPLRGHVPPSTTPGDWRLIARHALEPVADDILTAVGELDFGPLAVSLP